MTVESGPMSADAPRKAYTRKDYDMDTKDTSTRASCTCRPRWEGHECTVFTPAEQAMTDTIHADDWGPTILYDDQVQEAVAAVRPALYRGAAEAFHGMYAEGLPGRSLDFMQGLRHAADLLVRAADDGRDLTKGP